MIIRRPDVFGDVVMSGEIIIAETGTLYTGDDHVFNDLVSLTERSLESESSRRVYRQTFSAWRDFCRQNNFSPLDMRPGNVTDFLTLAASKATRQRQLSALRKLAQVAYILRPDDDLRRIHEALKLIKAPAVSVKGRRSERTKRALSPTQVDKLFQVWDEPSNTHRRNRALIAVLLLTGMRRSEAAVLFWDDIDFENGVITVRHGKGDKYREVPVAGDFALQALEEWFARLPEGRDYIFCPMERGDKIGGDRPLTGTDVYRIVKATELKSGIEFKPHDCRRTFITESISSGVPMHEVQANAGHARGETTLRYAQTTSARERRKNLKLRYGQ